jgi:predicted esterase
MKSKIPYIGICFLCLLPFNINAQNNVIKLWPDGIPGSLKSDTYIEEPTVADSVPTRFVRVTEPTLTVFLPPVEKASGAAVLICPLQDAQEAMRTIRRNATAWNINPRKIGVIGFSAGGHLASTLSTHYAEKVYDVKDTISARPDFSLLIYPVITFDASFTHAGSRRNLIGENPSEEVIRHFSNELQITEKTPPAFLVHSGDDKAVPVKNSISYYQGLQKFNIPSELHVFQKGGHGYGLSVDNGTQSAWPGLCITWLQLSGIL